jgi:hypothetical protein
MQALRKYIKSSEGNLIPCVGAQKIPLLISLLIGWDLEFLAVLDNDTEGKRIAKILSIKLLVEGKKIIFIAEKDGSSIEDLFTHKDFNDFVLNENKNDDTNLSNSRFIKDKKYDKVLLSKKFFEKVEENQTEIKLSQDTINAFKQVFNKISNGFK